MESIDFQSLGRMQLAAIVLVSAGCVERIIEPPVFVTGGSSSKAQVSCVQEFEGVSCSLSGRDGIGWVTAFGTNRVSWADGAFSNWTGGPAQPNSPGFPVAINQTDLQQLTNLGGDAWSDYSVTKDLVFVSFVGRPPMGSCVAVAATSPANLKNNIWDFPAVCLSGERADQCAIRHVDATNTFYSACKIDSAIRIRAFANCNGAPGQLNGCPETVNVLVPDAGVQSLQFDLKENPCTGNLMLVYRARTQIRLRIFDSQLRQVSDTLVRDNQSFAPGQTNAGCSNGTIRRCGLGTTDCCNPATANCQVNPQGQCLRVNGRPSIDSYLSTRINNPTCHAVVAYDSLAPGSDGNLWSKSRLDVIDVTNEIDPEIEARWVSTDDAFTWNHYMSYAVVGDRTRPGRSPAIGWFWLSDVRGACSTLVEGGTSINMGGRSVQPVLSAVPFPRPIYRRMESGTTHAAQKAQIATARWS